MSKSAQAKSQKKSGFSSSCGEHALGARVQRVRSARGKLRRNASAQESICSGSRRGAARRDRLKKLSNDDLLAELSGLHGIEREVQLEILYYLNEIERRRVYMSMAYSSLFEFCMGHMGYSRSSAGRRIRAARCLDRFPQAAELLRSGELNLCALAMISKILTTENADEILAQVKGKPVEDVEMIVARHRPGGRIRDRVKPVFIMSPVQTHEGGSNQDDHGATSCGHGNTAECANTLNRANKTNSSSDIGTKCKASLTFTPNIGSEKFPNDTQGRAGSAGAAQPEQVAVEQRFKIEFTVKPEFMKKYNKIKAMLSAKHMKNPGFEDIFTMLMDEYLGQHSPEARIEKRNRRQVKKRDAVSARCARKNKREHVKHKAESGKKPVVKNHAKKRPGSGRSRHVPQEIKDKIFVRDGGRCTFTSPDGRRCSETRNLQVDHIVPFAKGGSNAPENLRLLCFKHNQLMAEREFGSKHMKKFNRRE